MLFHRVKFVDTFLLYHIVVRLKLQWDYFAYISTCECEQYISFHSVLLYQSSLLEYIYLLVFYGTSSWHQFRNYFHVNIYICPIVDFFYSENLKKRDRLGNLAVDGRIILKSN
jgi:hypothetical protein